jgi:predicted dinucleotide-binding enzyme
MSCKRSLIAATFMVSLALPLAGRAETIAIIGTGEVSKALGPRLAGLGHQVIYGSRSPEDADARELVRASGENASAAKPREAAAPATIVMIAVPWNVAEQVVVGLGDLSGKIIVDPINPRIVAEDGYRDYPTHISSAERLQALAPRAFVIKAFNTISTDSMRDPDLLGHPITIPLAGNDAAAKETVAQLVEALGYEAVDVGPVRYAHIVEGMYLLRSNARDLLEDHFEFHFRRRETPIPQEIR